MSEKKKGLILNISLIIYGLLFQTVIISKFLKYSELISTAFILIAAFLAIRIFGLHRDKKTRVKEKILYKTIIVVLLYFIVSYGVSFLIGFNKNAYSTEPIMILKNVFSPLIIIICSEVYRFVFLGDVNKHSKYEKTTTLALSIFEICISYKFSLITNFLIAFKAITTVFLPIISKNIIMSKVIKYGGLKPVLIYRLLLDLYIYFIPILPGYNDYMTSILGICVPLLFYISILKEIRFKENIKEIKTFSKDTLFKNEMLIFIVIAIVSLISGVFPITVIGIGSDSMYPKINKGDAIIYKKVYNEDRIKIGDILVYYDEVQKRTIVHRLVEKKEINGVVYYITKGDANNSVDSINLTYKDIKGKVIFKLRYAATFSVWLNELLNKGVV